MWHSDASCAVKGWALILKNTFQKKAASDRDACQGTRCRSAACGIMMVRRLSTSGLGGAVAGSGKSERVCTEYNLKTASEGPSVRSPCHGNRRALNRHWAPTLVVNSNKTTKVFAQQARGVARTFFRFTLLYVIIIIMLTLRSRLHYVPVAGVKRIAARVLSL